MKSKLNIIGNLQYDSLVFIILCVFTFIIRFPYFFKENIDWDEHTFILLGQSVLDGELPYTVLWDNKPPFLNYIFGLILLISGKSIIGVRVFASIFVSLTSLLIFKILKQFKVVEYICLFGALLYIHQNSIIPNGLCFSSEQMALLPLLVSFYFLNNRLNYFLSGLFIGVSILVRLNLLYVLLFVGLYMFIKDLVTKREIQNSIKYSLGVLVSFFISLIPFLITGNTSIWFDSVFLAPLSYSKQHSILESLYGQMGNFFMAKKITIMLTPFIIGCFVSFLVVFNKKNWKNYSWIFVYFLATLWSIVSSGAYFFHYVLQLIPFSVIILVNTYHDFIKTRIKPIYHTVFLLIITIPVCVKGYGEIEKLDFSLKGEATEVYEYLSKNKITVNKPLFLTNHILHFYTKTKPLSKAITHPSNLDRSYLLGHIYNDPSMNSEKLLSNLLSQKPDVVLIDKNNEVFNKTTLNSQLEKELQDFYKLQYTFSNSKLYLLKDNMQN